MLVVCAAAAAAVPAAAAIMKYLLSGAEMVALGLLVPPPQRPIPKPQTLLGGLPVCL